MFDLTGRALVLGGGRLQARFIRDATQHGLEVTVLDRDAETAADLKRLADFQQVDIADQARVLAVARRVRPDFVYSPSTEVGNETAAHVSEALGLRYNSTRAVATSRDKRMQRALAAELSGFQSPRAHVAGSPDATRLLEVVGSVVVKPTGQSAGRGVSIARTAEELTQGIERAAAVSHGGAVLIEERIVGTQFSVETLSVDGVHSVVAVTKEHMSQPPSAIERSHLMNPSIHAALVSERLCASIAELLDAIGVEVGPSHVEVILSGSDLFLIEVATRAGAWRDRLMELAGYPNYNTAIVEAYLGKPSRSFETAPSRNALCNILLVPEDLKSVLMGRATGRLTDVDLFRDPVVGPENIADAFGYAFFASEHGLCDLVLPDMPTAFSAA